MEFNFSVDKASTLTDVATVLTSLSDVLKWIFFIMLAFIVIQIITYIKKKNATPAKNQHSQNTL